MASERDKAHFLRIAEAMELANREDLRASARRPPGENIERGLRLGSFGLELSRFRDKPSPPSLLELWRARKSGG